MHSHGPALLPSQWFLQVLVAHNDVTLHRSMRSSSYESEVLVIDIRRAGTAPCDLVAIPRFSRVLVVHLLHGEAELLLRLYFLILLSRVCATLREWYHSHDAIQSPGHWVSSTSSPARRSRSAILMPK